MDKKYVDINQLDIGDVIAEDIFANTSYPIVHKNTKVTHEHLQVFQAFNIHKVPIVNENNIKDMKKTDTIETKVDIEVSNFESKYQKAVQQFRREFLNWEAGAKVNITKIRTIILPLIENILENRTIIFELNSFSNSKEYLYHHCIATGLISATLTNKLGYDKGYVLQMAIAGTLADCGMAKIPKKIREKKGLLTEFEFDEIRKHPLYSFNMVKDFTSLRNEMKVAIYQHHERLDGSGYPQGRKMKKISIFAQIIAVADTFHAMTSERVYRSKESPFKVIEMIKESEFGKFNIQTVDALINLVADLPIGTKVELSNLEQGEIIFINQFSPTRPLVKLISTGEIIDLSANRSFFIKRVIMD